MTLDRRALLTGGASALLLPIGLTGGARAGATDADALYVSSARRGDGSYCVVIVTASGRVVREHALNDRGHDVAVSPDGKLAVAFARRPGTFAVAFDTRGAKPPVVFETPPARHFFGHGVFSADGRLLYATENDYEGGRGVLGIYDVAARFHRIGELPSHGLGPHDLLLLGDGRTLCVANGGIETHPDAGRADLNLDTMRPSLAFLDSATGDLVAEHVLPGALNQLSIRHLCRDGAGKVWFGGQWQGSVASSPVLIGSAGRDSPIGLVTAGEEMLGSGLKGYIGSVSSNAGGGLVAASAPKAGIVVFIDPATARVLGSKVMRDVCGVAPAGPAEMALSSGDGVLSVGAPPSSDTKVAVVQGLAFDNHLRLIDV